jgi:VanZ family protein
LKNIFQFKSWVPALLWMISIFFINSQPIPDIVQHLPKVNGLGLGNPATSSDSIHIDIPWFALAHLGEYAGLTFWIVFGMLDGKIGRPAALGSVLGRAVLLALFVALMDEVYQIGVPGRHFQWVDLGMDLMGMLLAGAGVFGIRRIINRREPPEKR